MNYYIDIKLSGDTEISLGYIWQKVYAQMHLALVEQKNSEGMCRVGFSFPHYKEVFPLGDMLRLFSHTKEELELLNVEKQLKNFLDYVLVSGIKEVPNDVHSYVTFSRKQVKCNSERLARRQAKRKGISFEEALKNYEEFDEEKKKEKNKLPYINIDSLSSQNKMKVFVAKEISLEPKEGLFSTYGLSKTSTVPCF